jgi:hypothetical protein
MTATTFTADDVQTVTLTTSATNAHINLAPGSTFMDTADKLTSITANASGDDSSDITLAALGATDAAAALTTVTVTAADGADVTIGAIDAEGASLTSVSLTASTTGSVITMSGLGLDGTNITSIAAITGTAVSGATVDIENIEATTVGQLTFSGAGTFRADGTDMDITTLEMINAQNATGSVTIVMEALGSATIVNLGSGTNSYLASTFADTINLASAAGTDKIIQNPSSSQNVITVNNFTSGTDQIRLDDSELSTASALIAGATLDLVDGNSASQGTAGNMNLKEMTADTTLAAGDDLVILVGATFTDTNAVETAMETGAYEITMATASAQNDALFVVYSDGTDAYLAAVRFAAATPTAAVAATELTVVNLVKLAGTTSIAAGDFTSGDFYMLA